MGKLQKILSDKLLQKPSFLILALLLSSVSALATVILQGKLRLVQIVGKQQKFMTELLVICDQLKPGTKENKKNLPIEGDFKHEL